MIGESERRSPKKEEEEEAEPPVPRPAGARSHHVPQKAEQAPADQA